MPFPLLIPSFFFASWLMMIFWGMVVPDTGVQTIGYPKAMLVTIGLWLVVFPLARRNKGGGGGRRFAMMGGRPRRDRKKDSDRTNGGASGGGTQTIDRDEIDINSSFGGISRRLTSQNFTGGNVNTNFGGVQLDLRDAALANNEATIRVQAFIGGLEVTVPAGWDVQTDVDTNIGGVSDERDSPGDPDSGAPTLTIKGSATLGGISIKD